MCRKSLVWRVFDSFIQFLDEIICVLCPDDNDGSNTLKQQRKRCEAWENLRPPTYPWKGCKFLPWIHTCIPDFFWMLIYTYLSTYSHIHIIMEISTLELSFDTNLHLSVISHSQHCIKYFVFLLSQQETQHNCAAQLCKKGKQSINSQWLGNWN